MFLLHKRHTSLLKSEFIPTWTLFQIFIKKKENQDGDKDLGSEASLSLDSASVTY